MELERCWSCVGEVGKDYQDRDRVSTDSSETSPGNESLLDGSLWSLISCPIVRKQIGHAVSLDHVFDRNYLDNRGSGRPPMHGEPLEYHSSYTDHVLNWP